MKRITRRELLDDDRGEPREIQAAFDDLWRINRWLGGVSGSLRLLDRFFARTGPHAVRLLDVGAGDGRLAEYLTQELRRRGVRADFFIVDRRITHLRSEEQQSLAAAALDSKHGLPERQNAGAQRLPPQKRANRSPRVAADALGLPFARDGFEIVTCNLFLHHFSGESARELLRALVAVASEAVLINDLDRRWLPYLLIRYAPFIARSSMTRADGPASVRQAYTRTEMLTLAAESGARGFEVMKLPFFRLGLILWKTPIQATP